MKIIHTSDWHIGKKLHHYDLQEDFDLFCTWLIQIIQEKDVELLLISGDIFDLANPSSTSRQQYYALLMQLKNIDCKIVLTAGNHDSPSVLNAPKDLLKALDIQVVGQISNHPEDYILPIQDKNGNTAVVIHAIPFLRDADVRKASDGVSYADRVEAIQSGIEITFKNASEYGKTTYPHLPQIALGHLFTAGVSTSDSEREIQMGNEAKLDAHRLGNDFDYVALGHIHKPQKVNAAIPIYYSGSPIPLSFSERKDEKRILLIDTEKGFEPEIIQVPQFRKLLKIKGNFDEIESKINNLNEFSQLTTLIELELIEPEYSIELEDRFLQLVNDFEHPKAKIVKPRMHFKDKVLGAHELFDNSKQIDDLQPIDMFSKLLDTQEINEEDRKELQTAFNDLVEIVLREEI